MADALLREQRDDGTFLGSVDRDPLTTAAAAAGLAAVLREQSVPDPRLSDALEHALASLSAIQDDEALFRHSDDRTEQDRALTQCVRAPAAGPAATVPRDHPFCRADDLV